MTKKKETMEPVPTPSKIDPACGGDPLSSIVSRSKVGPDIDTRALDWEVNGEEETEHEGACTWQVLETCQVHRWD